MKAVDAKFVQRNAAFLLDTLLSLVGIILLTLYFFGEKNPLYSVIILYDPLQKYFYYMKNQKYGGKNWLDIYKCLTIKKIWGQTPISTVLIIEC